MLGFGFLRGTFGQYLFLLMFGQFRKIEKELGFTFLSFSFAHGWWVVCFSLQATTDRHVEQCRVRGGSGNSFRQGAGARAVQSPENHIIYKLLLT